MIRISKRLRSKYRMLLAETSMTLQVAQDFLAPQSAKVILELLAEVSHFLQEAPLLVTRSQQGHHPELHLADYAVFGICSSYVHRLDTSNSGSIARSKVTAVTGLTYLGALQMKTAKIEDKLQAVLTLRFAGADAMAARKKVDGE